MTYGRLEGAGIAGIVGRGGNSAGPPQPQPEKMMEGRKVPSVVFKTRVRDESVGGPNPFRWQDVRSDELFQGKRVVLFSLPGAFTPTCSNEQCPAFERLYDDFKDLGIDEVYCLSVNDAFVMYQWGKSLNLKKVKLIPDGSGHFTRRMGMLIDKDHVGFGFRSWRYAMVVKDGVVEKWFEEPGINDEGENGDPYGESSPETVLTYLRS
ncbi:peroxiredoxin [Azospirillum oryzae]|nr:peroxiredoxin [Azospirillum oryzae]GLR82003.1 peroxiredoxin [Azospirillum oryzae]